VSTTPKRERLTERRCGSFGIVLCEQLSPLRGKLLEAGDVERVLAEIDQIRVAAVTTTPSPSACEAGRRRPGRS
jgi:hypothetical protein